MGLAIMKNVRWQGIVFLVLIFILTIGLSYIAFNENSIEVDNKQQKMSIALVNEDEGAVFNDQKIVFGDQFSDSVQKDNNHDWYVVSRGVAESGIDRNVYDMMVTIPNDFSERSLSIHLENPEPVSLHYKVNATGHESVRAEAEKTAGKVLNDFNRRLIDVYFASIIGNLQEAQDNIGGIVEQEKKYAAEYRQNVHSPLSGFTDQFGLVKSHTETSKKSYQSLEEILESFEDNLGDELKDKQSFASEIETVLKTADEDSKATQVFSDVLDGFTQEMSNDDVMTLLRLIERENAIVSEEFENGTGKMTIANNADDIKQRFVSLSDRMSQYEEDFHNQFHTQLAEKVRTGLDSNFHEVYDGAFNSLFATLDDQILGQIKDDLIPAVPTLDVNELETLGFTGKTLTELKNVVYVTNQFSENETNGKKTETDISKAIQAVKQELLTEGLSVEENLKIPTLDADESEQLLFIHAPKEFKVTEVSLNKGKVQYNANGIDMSGYEDGTKLDVQMKLRSDVQRDFDIFAPVEWEWEISQEGTTEATESNEENGGNSRDEITEEKDSSSTAEEDSKKEAASREAVSKEKDETELDEAKSKEVGNTEGDEKDNEDVGSGTEEEEEPSDEEDEDEIEEEDATEEPITVVITETSHYISKKVRTFVHPDITKTMMDAAVKTVNDYYKLQSAYELYYGIDFTDQTLKDKLKHNKLSELATKNSLYNFIHEKDINSILKEHVTKNVTEQVTKDVQQLAAKLEGNINEYNESLSQATNKSDDLIDNITETRKNATVLNEEINNLLVELGDWRNASQQLQEEKNAVITSDGEFQTAVMSLDGSYQPLLLASESIRQQASSNFDIANNVYQNFEAIDKQADEIENSGTNLVQHANDLADKLTEKALEDTNYAENFNEVLENSRVGDRQNESLYSFLANPVQTKNDGIITKDESFTPYFIVLVISIITLFTAYVISTLNERNMLTVDGTEKSMMAHNLPITVIISAIGLFEGIVIGLVSFYLLNIERETIYMWLGLITLVTMLILFLSTYLLRQLKMIGMFVILSVMSLYLFVNRSLSFKFEHKELIEILRQISPLQLIENVLYSIIEGNGTISFIVFILFFVIAVIGCLLNLLVFSQVKEEGIESESATEAN